MKNLSNSLFKKFEPNKINNLAKIIGGKEGKTTWSGGGTSGCDTANTETKEGPIVTLEGETCKCDFKIAAC
jgi:hypothetical protein